MRTFFDLFARSPFEPLTRHAEKVHEVVDQVRPLTEAFLAEDWAETERIYEQISRLEHKADKIKKEIRSHLPRSLFLPVDRGDLLGFLKEQDAIADAVEDVAVLMNMRRTTGPDSLKTRMRALVDAVVGVTDTWFQMASELPDLQEASFTGPEVGKVLELIDGLNTEEWEADKVQAALSREAVEHEDELGPFAFYFWMRIASKVGEIANHAENSGDRLRMMLAKS